MTGPCTLPLVSQHSRVETHCITAATNFMRFFLWHFKKPSMHTKVLPCRLPDLLPVFVSWRECFFSPTLQCTQLSSRSSILVDRPIPRHHSGIFVYPSKKVPKLLWWRGQAFVSIHRPAPDRIVTELRGGKPLLGKKKFQYMKVRTEG